MRSGNLIIGLSFAGAIGIQGFSMKISGSTAVVQREVNNPLGWALQKAFSFEVER